MKKIEHIAILVVLVLFSVLFMQAAFPGTVADPADVGRMVPSPQSDGQSQAQPVKIVVDAGHGGSDPGVTKNHMVESEITLDIAKKLKAYLEEKAYKVEMTRESNISLYLQSYIGDTIQRRELNARTDLINRSGAAMFASIHVNSYPGHPGMSGSIVYYNPMIPGSLELAEAVQKRLNSIKTADFRRDRNCPEKADFFLLEYSIIPGILIETAFITNPKEYRLLGHDSFRSEIAGAVSAGIADYLGKAG